MKLYYRFTKGEGVPIVLLHGWGGCMDSFLHVEKFFIEKNCSVLNVDLLGFGKSDEPSKVFGIYHYAIIVKMLLISLGIKEYNLIGHSFGGRIGIVLASNLDCLNEYNYIKNIKLYFINENDESKDSMANIKKDLNTTQILDNKDCSSQCNFNYSYNPNIKKIILLDSAGCKPKRSIKYYFKVYTYKIKKHFFSVDCNNVGSDDYRLLTEQMKRVFVNVVNQHLDKLLCKIHTETLIVWGIYDKDTPLYMAKRINKKIKNSGLVLLDGGHFCYLEKHFQFCNISNNFFNSNF